MGADACAAAISAKMSSLPTGVDGPFGRGAGGGSGNCAAGIGVRFSARPGGRGDWVPPLLPLMPGGVPAYGCMLARARGESCGEGELDCPGEARRPWNGALAKLGDARFTPVQSAPGSVAPAAARPSCGGGNGANPIDDDGRCCC